MQKRTSEYEPINELPVARFYYQGTHSHPIRRTVVITKSTRKTITGYEIREGAEVRDFSDAPIKSYLRKHIATMDRLGARKHREPGPAVSSLVRLPLVDVLRRGA